MAELKNLIVNGVARVNGELYENQARVATSASVGAVQQIISANSASWATNTKVTAVGNHYTPAQSTGKAATSGQVLTGIGLDAAGHVTSVTSSTAITAALATNATNLDGKAASQYASSSHTHAYVSSITLTTGSNYLTIDSASAVTSTGTRKYDLATKSKNVVDWVVEASGSLNAGKVGGPIYNHRSGSLIKLPFTCVSQRRVYWELEGYGYPNGVFHLAGTFQVNTASITYAYHNILGDYPPTDLTIGVDSNNYPCIWVSQSKNYSNLQFSAFIVNSNTNYGSTSTFTNIGKPTDFKVEVSSSLVGLYYAKTADSSSQAENSNKLGGKAASQYASSSHTHAYVTAAQSSASIAAYISGAFTSLTQTGIYLTASIGGVTRSASIVSASRAVSAASADAATAAVSCSGRMYIHQRNSNNNIFYPVWSDIPEEYARLYTTTGSLSFRPKTGLLRVNAIVGGQLIGSASGTITLIPGNTTYIDTPAGAITLVTGSDQEGYANIYHCQIKMGSTLQSVTVPGTLTEGSALINKANCTYEISILNSVTIITRT